MQSRTRNISNFKQRVLNVVAQIPKGETRTYKDVAVMAGSPNAYRAVGKIMNRNRKPKVPCHRVIKSNGSVGGYNGGGPKRKTEMLRKEGAI